VSVDSAVDTTARSEYWRVTWLGSELAVVRDQSAAALNRAIGVSWCDQTTLVPSCVLSRRSVSSCDRFAFYGD